MSGSDALLPDPPELDMITWRPASFGDTTAIADLHNACFEIDGGYRITPAEVENALASEDDNPTSDTLIAQHADRSLVAIAWSQIPKGVETEWRAFSWNNVHPDWRGHGLGHFLLEWTEARGRQRLSLIEDDLPKSFDCRPYDWQAAQIALLEQQGYRPVRHFFEMLRDLGEPLEQSQPVEGIEIEPWSPPRAEAARIAHNEAFADHWRSQPVSRGRWHKEILDEFFLPDASYVAVDRDRVVAYVISFKYPHDFEDRQRTESWVEGVGTVRAHRGQGLATNLLLLAMNDFQADGMEYACLTVDAENETRALGLYERLGFAVEKRSILYTKPVFE